MSVKKVVYLLGVALLVVGCVSVTRVSLEVAGGMSAEDTTPVLSWELSRAVLNGRIHVYVDESKNAVTSENSTPVSLDVSRKSLKFGVDSPPLKWNRVYYWKVKVIEKDSLGTEIGWYESSVSSFTTPSTPVFSITAPASGSAVNDLVNLEWEVNGRFNEVAFFQVVVNDASVATAAYSPDKSRYSVELDLSDYHNDAAFVELRCVEKYPHGETTIYDSTPVRLLVFGEVKVENMEPSKGIVEDIVPELRWTLQNEPPSDNFIFEVVVATSCDAQGDPVNPVIVKRVNTESMKVGEDSTPLDWNEEYYWQVRVLLYNSDGEEVGVLKSNTAYFETRPEPKPLIISPASTEIEATECTVSWAFNGTEYVSMYELRVNGTLEESTTTTSCVVDFSGYSGQDVNVTVTAIEVYGDGSKKLYEGDPVTYKVK